MKRTWQDRLDKIGIERSDLQTLTGHDRVALYRHLNGKVINGTTLRLRATIVALEIMTQKQREEWLERMRAGEAERDR